MVGFFMAVFFWLLILFYKPIHWKAGTKATFNEW